jgi:hypothetical protein
MDEARLQEKLARIEALFAGGATPGERAAAASARDRILERLRAAERVDPAVEYRFSMSDMWQRRLFLSLVRRYGLEPYRRPGQRYTTVMVRVPKRFVDMTLWPEFQELSQTLRAYLDEVTDRVVSKVVHPDSSEAAEIPEGLPPACTA